MYNELKCNILATEIVLFMIYVRGLDLLALRISMFATGHITNAAF